MWLPIRFANAVRKHWVALVPSGAAIGLLGMWQSLGHTVAHSLYWSVAVIGLVVAFYRAWLDQYQEVVKLIADRDGEVAKQRREEKKRELIQALTALRAIEKAVLHWMDITLDKWGMAPSTVKLLPADWPTIVYVAESLSPDLRKKADLLGNLLSEANDLIERFLSVPVNYRNAGLMPPAHALLQQGVPFLSTLIAELEAYEKSLG